MGIEIRQGNGPNRGSTVHLAEDKSGNTVGYGDQYSQMRSVLRFNVTRTTFGNAVMGYLPPGAIPMGLRYLGTATSNSSTTATIVVGLDTTTNFLLVATAVQIALTGGGIQNPTAAQMGVPFPLGTALPLNEHPVTASYAEGATSTTGGPWAFEVDFWLP